MMYSLSLDCTTDHCAVSSWPMHTNLSGLHLQIIVIASGDAAWEAAVEITTRHNLVALSLESRNIGVNGGPYLGGPTWLR